MKQNIELDKAIEAIQHQNEIERTRTGGFGGSDAKMFYKIGLKGLSALSNSDKKRIRVAKGIDEYKPIFQTEAMRKGHEFEDWWFEDNLYLARSTWEREVKIERELATNFKTFAHADASREVRKQIHVIELKCLSDPSFAFEQYKAQLQWYYMLGAHSASILIGDNSKGGDFDEMPILEHYIKRDEQLIKMLLHGIKLLDDNWENLNLNLPEEWTSEDLLPFEATEVELMTNYLQEIKRLEVLIEEKKNNLLQFMQDNDVKSINSENYIITNVPVGTTSRFNKAKLLKDFPEIDESKYTTVSERKGYITIKLK